MFKKILVATDLSRASESMICTMGGLLALGTREALLVECLNVRDVGGLASSLTAAIGPELERQRARLAGLGFVTEAKVVVGLPQIEINRLAEENNCSLVVIGSRGATAFRELLLGSVASAILHHSTRPVLVLRVNSGALADGTFCEPPACDFREHVLFPTDFSDNAEHAYRSVQAIAGTGARRITLLHVLAENVGNEAHDLAKARLARMQKDLLALGASDVQLELPQASAKHEIVARVRQKKYDLVVVGSQGQGLVPGAVLGSVSHAVAYQAVVPVLFVPLPR